MSLLLNPVIQVFLVIVFFCSMVGTVIYRKFAMRIGIVANLNFRTLHKHPTPRGGGIIFSQVFVLAIVLFSLFFQLESELFQVFVVGAAAAAVFGFVDDVVVLRARSKFFFQVLISVWTLYCFKSYSFLGEVIPWEVGVWLSWGACLFLLVWMINLYNFMDGVDGIAASGGIFFCLTAAVALLVSSRTGTAAESMLFIMLALGTSALGFLIFNWPKASVFMGDSGSVFFGYCFGALIIYSVQSGMISIWTWLTLMGYFLADTAMTIMLRLFLVKKWYGAHRSHAYQNLARITDSHLKITGGVTLYHLFWILPLTLWSVMVPQFALAAVFFALTPVVVLAYKYGPRLSSS